MLFTGRRGRPKFNVSNEQLEYLSLLSLSWSEIVVLVGVSRTTSYSPTLRRLFVEHLRNTINLLHPSIPP